MIKTKSIILGCALMGVTQLSMAEIPGTYTNDAKDACTLTITPIEAEAPLFGDGFWLIQSRGPASCMWDSVGISHSTELVGGTISLPPLSPRGFVQLKWVFGPASSQVDMQQIGVDGKLLPIISYMRQ